MKQLTVRLDIVTSSMTLAELSDRLGLKPSPGSADRGTPHRSGYVLKETHW
ncbi:MAG: hypothetical protein HY318_12760 [Armatimonadetes bacterium]|nr:hypothetical protein [Armatimonadota bacterium]